MWIIVNSSVIYRDHLLVGRGDKFLVLSGEILVETPRCLELLIHFPIG